MYTQINSATRLGKQHQVARDNSELVIVSHSPKTYDYLNTMATLRIEEMRQHIGLERRNAQRQLSAKNGIIAEILFGHVLRTKGIQWLEPGAEIRRTNKLNRDLGDYEIDKIVYDLKSSDIYASISSYKRTDAHCKIDYIIGSYININPQTKVIELYIFGIRHYERMLTIEECMQQWNVRYQILNPKDFIPLSKTGLFPQFENTFRIRLK